MSHHQGITIISENENENDSLSTSGDEIQGRAGEDDGVNENLMDFDERDRNRQSTPVDDVDEKESQEVRFNKNKKRLLSPTQGGLDQLFNVDDVLRQISDADISVVAAMQAFWIENLQSGKVISEQQIRDKLSSLSIEKEIILKANASHKPPKNTRINPQETASSTISDRGFPPLTKEQEKLENSPKKANALLARQAAEIVELKKKLLAANADLQASKLTVKKIDDRFKQIEDRFESTAIVLTSIQKQLKEPSGSFADVVGITNQLPQLVDTPTSNERPSRQFNSWIGRGRSNSTGREPRHEWPTRRSSSYTRDQSRFAPTTSSEAAEEQAEYEKIEREQRKEPNVALIPRDYGDPKGSIIEDSYRPIMMGFIRKVAKPLDDGEEIPQGLEEDEVVDHSKSISGIACKYGAAVFYLEDTANNGLSQRYITATENGEWERYNIPPLKFMFIKDISLKDCFVAATPYTDATFDEVKNLVDTDRRGLLTTSWKVIKHKQNPRTGTNVWIFTADRITLNKLLKYNEGSMTYKYHPTELPLYIRINYTANPIGKTKTLNLIKIFDYRLIVLQLANITSWIAIHSRQLPGSGLTIKGQQEKPSDTWSSLVYPRKTDSACPVISSNVTPYCANRSGCGKSRLGFEILLLVSDVSWRCHKFMDKCILRHKVLLAIILIINKYDLCVKQDKSRYFNVKTVGRKRNFDWRKHKQRNPNVNTRLNLIKITVSASNYKAFVINCNNLLIPYCVSSQGKSIYLENCVRFARKPKSESKTFLEKMSSDMFMKDNDEIDRGMHLIDDEDVSAQSLELSAAEEGKGSLHNDPSRDEHHALLVPSHKDSKDLLVLADVEVNHSRPANYAKRFKVAFDIQASTQHPRSDKGETDVGPRQDCTRERKVDQHLKVTFRPKKSHAKATRQDDRPFYSPYPRFPSINQSVNNRSNAIVPYVTVYFAPQDYPAINIGNMKNAMVAIKYINAMIKTATKPLPVNSTVRSAPSKQRSGYVIPKVNPPEHIKKFQYFKDITYQSGLIKATFSPRPVEEARLIMFDVFALATDEINWSLDAHMNIEIPKLTLHRESEIKPRPEAKLQTPDFNASFDEALEEIGPRTTSIKGTTLLTSEWKLLEQEDTTDHSTVAFCLYYMLIDFETAEKLEAAGSRVSLPYGVYRERALLELKGVFQLTVPPQVNLTFHSFQSEPTERVKMSPIRRRRQDGHMKPDKWLPTGVLLEIDWDLFRDANKITRIRVVDANHRDSCFKIEFVHFKTSCKHLMIVLELLCELILHEIKQLSNFKQNSGTMIYIRAGQQLPLVTANLLSNLFTCRKIYQYLPIFHSTSC